MSEYETSTMPSSPIWLERAVFYEIYPQSFYDSNADGIGDIPGIIEKLDYIENLGCNALWINPCFDSPFKDAGYDVRDYLSVAPRYGTNDDLISLFVEAHRRHMHVLLDLVPGHTSEEHRWFESSKQVEHNEFTDRYIWTNSAFQGYSMPFIGGESERDATYILNFFKCQPALNYGFAKRDQPWQMSVDSPAARATQDAMVEVVRFWLERGCDGFRVDMANSLVKNDGDDKSETIGVWRRMLSAVKRDYPQSAFVSEWGVPQQALAAGFDMDFYLDWRWGGKGNGYNLLARNVDNALDRQSDHSYFFARGGSSICEFLDQYLPQYEATKDDGYFCFITCNHDTPRLAPRLDQRERQIAYGMLLTMPGVPFLYYGDEIGMRYRNLPTKEGGYARTGSRTPMQWDSRENLGFSKADGDSLYLPVDSASDAPTVASQTARSDSMLSWTKQILRIRASRAALHAGARFDVLAAPENGRSFVYMRSAFATKNAGPASVHASGESERIDAENQGTHEAAPYSDADKEHGERIVIAMNPGTSEETVMLPQTVVFDERRAACVLGEVRVDGRRLILGPQSFAMFEE
jgi:maltose alpha-D-glucosyltransferase/alpha-amylase